MLEEYDGVMFLKLFEELPPLSDRRALVGCNLTEELSEALAGGGVALIFILPLSHLLAEGEGCNTGKKKKRIALISTLLL